jgi:membrane protein
MSEEQLTWKTKLRNMPVVAKSVHYLDTLRPPGFQGLSLWYVSSFFAESIVKGQLATRASAISFRIFLAFFPAIIILLTLIPYIPIDDFQKSLFDSIRGFFPGDTFSLFEETLDDLINQKHSGLLSLGTVLLLYYASNSINAILIGFNQSYHFEDKSHPLVMRISSIILIFVLGFIMLLAVVVLVFSGVIFEYLHQVGIIGDRGYLPILNVAKWAVSITLVYAIISTLYNVGVRKRIRRWTFWNVGATLATLSFVVTSLAFAYFVNNFATYNKLYGSLGTLMVLLIWLNINCVIVLIGFDLNVSIRKARRSVPKPKPVIKNTIRE